MLWVVWAREHCEAHVQEPIQIPKGFRAEIWVVKAEDSLQTRDKENAG